MTEFLQTTLNQSAEFRGVGVHTGVEATVTVRPGDVGSGIVFRRTDLFSDARKPSDCTILAEPSAVACVRLGTRLKNHAGATVATVEHLMAALCLCGVDNAIVDVDGAEIPILDGSAAPFVEGLLGAGVKPQKSRRRPIELQEVVEVVDGDRVIRAEPSDERILDVTIDFPDAPAIGRQSVELNLDQTEQAAIRLARARTFCRLSDVEAMRAAGFALGGAMDNAIVVDGRRVLNDGELRDSAEFVLHKALDLLGDVYLLGAPLKARITAIKPGHDLNTMFASAVQARLSTPVAACFEPRQRAIA